MFSWCIECFLARQLLFIRSLFSIRLHLLMSISITFFSPSFQLILVSLKKIMTRAQTKTAHCMTARMAAPIMRVPRKISHEVLTNPEQFQKCSHGIDLIRGPSAELIAIRAPVVHKDRYLIAHAYN